MSNQKPQDEDYREIVKIDWNKPLNLTPEQEARYDKIAQKLQEYSDQKKAEWQKREQQENGNPPQDEDYREIMKLDWKHPPKLTPEERAEYDRIEQKLQKDLENRKSERQKREQQENGKPPQDEDYREIVKIDWKNPPKLTPEQQARYAKIAQKLQEYSDQERAKILKQKQEEQSGQSSKPSK